MQTVVLHGWSVFLRAVPSEADRNTLLSWLHRVVLHTYPVLYLWDSFDRHFPLSSVYFCGIAIVTALTLARPIPQVLGVFAGWELRLGIACFSAAPLAVEVLLCRVLRLRSSCPLLPEGNGLLPALAGVMGLAHHWFLMTFAPPGMLQVNRPSRRTLAASPSSFTTGGGSWCRAWRLCLLLVAGASLDYNFYGAIYFLTAVAIMLAASSQPLHDVLFSFGVPLETWRKSLMAVAVLHLSLACASVLVLYFRNGDEGPAWWRLFLVEPSDVFQKAQCFFALILVGEMQSDAGRWSGGASRASDRSASPSELQPRASRWSQRAPADTQIPEEEQLSDLDFPVERLQTDAGRWFSRTSQVSEHSDTGRRSRRASGDPTTHASEQVDDRGAPAGRRQSDVQRWSRRSSDDPFLSEQLGDPDEPIGRQPSEAERWPHGASGDPTMVPDGDQDDRGLGVSAVQSSLDTEEDEDADILERVVQMIPMQLLVLSALCCWPLVWPAMPSVPLLLIGIGLLWRPEYKLSRKQLMLMTAYSVTLCLALYFYALVCTGRGNMIGMLDAGIAGATRARTHSTSSRAMAALGILSQTLAYCTRRRGGVDDEDLDEETLEEEDPKEKERRRVSFVPVQVQPQTAWQWRAIRGLFVLRTLSVAIILALGIHRDGGSGNSSLAQMGYICWFIALLHFKEVHQQSRGWDVLQGRKMLWRGLLFYSGGIAVALILWRTCNRPNLFTIGFVNSEGSVMFTSVSPHLIVAACASVNKYAMKQPWVNAAMLNQVTSSAHLLLRFGVFAQMSILLLAVLLPPASIDSFIFLVLFVAIMTVGQITMSRKLLVPLLRLISEIACALLMLRCVIMMRVVQHGLEWLLDPAKYPKTWKSLALAPASVSPTTQYLLAVLLLLSRALGRTIKLALTILDEEVHPIGLTAVNLRQLQLADSWFPLGLLLVAYVVTASSTIHFLSSLTILAVLTLLFTGRDWFYAGTIISFCTSIALLVQYLSLFNLTELAPDEQHARCTAMALRWGFCWHWGEVCKELVLILLSILQRAVHYSAQAEEGTEEEAARVAARGSRASTEVATAAAQSGPAETPSALAAQEEPVEAVEEALGLPEACEADEDEETEDKEHWRILVYDVQVAAVALVMLALMRSSFWSVVFAIVVGEFVRSGDAPEELSDARAWPWMRAMASALLIALTWENVLTVWMRLFSGFQGEIGASVVCFKYDSSVRRSTDGRECKAADDDIDCLTQYERCTADWADWFHLSGTTGQLEFFVFFAVICMRSAGPLIRALLAPDDADASTDAPLAARAAHGSLTEGAGGEPASNEGPPSPGSNAQHFTIASFDTPESKRESVAQHFSMASFDTPEPNPRAPVVQHYSIASFETRGEAGGDVQVAVSASEGDRDTGSEAKGLAVFRRLCRCCNDEPDSEAAEKRLALMKKVLIYGSVTATWLLMLGAFIYQGESNAITMGYLWLIFLEVSAVYDFGVDSDPIAAHLKLTRVIGTFNIVVAISCLAFQCPAVPCPYSLETIGTEFLSSKQCRAVQKNEADRGSSHSLGTLFGVLGLMKSSCPLLQGAFGMWNLLICGSCLIEGICMVRWQSELEEPLKASREHLKFRAGWYMEQHQISRNFQLKIWDTKRQVLLSKLCRLTERLNAIRAIWDDHRPAFTEEEEREYHWSSRVENLCLRSGIRRSKVEVYLMDFNKASALDRDEPMDAQSERLMCIAVDKLLLEYLYQLRLRDLRMITKEEEDAAKAKLLQDCEELDKGVASKAAVRRERRASEVYQETMDTQKRLSVRRSVIEAHRASLIDAHRQSQLDGHRQSQLLPMTAQRSTVSAAPSTRRVTFVDEEPGDVEMVNLGALQSELAHAVQDLEEKAADEVGAAYVDGDNRLVAILRAVCYDLIDDFLFIGSADETQFQHRRRSSVLGLFQKVICSQTTPLLIISTMLQFMEYRSIPAAVSVAGMCLALSVYPHVPWQMWTLLYRWNSLVVSLKILFQLPIFCKDGTMSLNQTCEPPTSMPWTYAFGLVKKSNETSIGRLLWADLLVCALVLANMHAVLQSGRYGRKLDSQHDALNEDDIPAEERELQREPSSSSFLGEQQSLLTFERKEMFMDANAMNLTRITKAHFAVWRRVVMVVDPESKLTFKHFLTSTTMRRPSKDLYLPRFLIVLVLLFILVFNWQAMTGEGRTIAEAMSSNHFSGTQVFVLILFMLLIVSDRILYTWYRSDLYSDTRSDMPVQKMSSSRTTNASPDDFSMRHSAMPRNQPEQDPDGEDDVDTLKELRVFVRMLHQVLLMFHLVILHFVFIHHWGYNSFDCAEGCHPHNSLLVKEKWVLILFYCLYVLYVVLSSLQLRYDVHLTRGGMRFTTSTDFFTKLCFRVYSVIPFLHELRVLTDWTSTVTALDFFMWMKLEDAHHNLYRVRGDMEIRALFPPGKKRPACEKLYMGGLLLFLLLALLIGPIAYFSSLNSFARIPNSVVFSELSVSLEISFGNHSSNSGVRSLNLYKAQAQMIQLTDKQKSGETQQKVDFPFSSDSFWMISASAQKSVSSLLKEHTDVEAKLVLAYTFDREATAVKSTGRDESAPLDNETVNIFAEVLQGATGKTFNVSVQNIFVPKKRLTAGAQAINLYNQPNRTVRLQIVYMDGSLPHWSLYDGEYGTADKQVSCDITSDDVASGGFSVHSLYLGVIMTIGNALRLIFKDSSKRVIYEEVPDTDLLFDLCDGIYIARIQGDLDAEYKLYYELIRVYRSPELLARVSQPKSLTRHVQANGEPARASQTNGGGTPGLRRRGRVTSRDEGEALGRRSLSR